MWKDYCGWSGEEDGHCTPRPANSQDDHRVYYFMRSNQRRVLHCMHLAVSDIQALAKQLQRVDRELLQLSRKVEEAQRRRWEERKYGESADIGNTPSV